MDYQLLIYFSAGLIIGSFLYKAVWGFYSKKLKQSAGIGSYFFGEITWQYLGCGLLGAGLFVLFYLKYGQTSIFLWRDLFFSVSLLFIVFFDSKYYLILDKIIWPLGFAALIINVVLGFNYTDLLSGFILGGVFFGLQYWLTRSQGLGWGDVKLAAVIGLLLGWQQTLLTIILAYIIGGIIAIILLVSHQKKWNDILPMGSFLAGAAIIVLLCGDYFLSWIFI